jgi:thioesterase domain-containing protein
MDRAFDVFLGITQGIRDYKVLPYDGKTFLFKAIDAINPVVDDPTMGWGEYVQDLKVFKIPGDHYTVMTEPHVKVLAEKLRSCL